MKRNYGKINDEHLELMLNTIFCNGELLKQFDELDNSTREGGKKAEEELSEKLIKIISECLERNNIPLTEDNILISISIYRYYIFNAKFVNHSLVNIEDYNIKLKIRENINKLNFDEISFSSDMIISKLKGYPLKDVYTELMRTDLIGVYGYSSSMLSNNKNSLVEEAAREIFPLNSVSKDILTDSFMNEFNQLLEKYQLENIDDKVYKCIEECIDNNYTTFDNAIEENISPSLREEYKRRKQEFLSKIMGGNINE